MKRFAVLDVVFECGHIGYVKEPQEWSMISFICKALTRRSGEQWGWCSICGKFQPVKQFNLSSIDPEINGGPEVIYSA